MDKQPRALSPSQIRMYRQCNRRWAFKYIDGVEVDSNRFAQMGTRVHAVLEKWLSDGEAPDIDTDEGKIAAAGLKHLPPPGDSLDVEAHVVYPRSDEIEYHGYCDLIDLSKDEPIITDHKTTVNFKWAKTEEELREDVQSTIYAAAVQHATKADAVILRWVYYRTRGKPTSKLVQIRVTKDDIEQAMIPVDETAREIYNAYKQAKPAEQTTYDARSCDLYGGCPYRELCNLSPMERIRSIMAKTDLAAKMRARKAGKNNPTQEETPPIINAPEKPADMKQSIAEKMRARQAAKTKASTAEVEHVLEHVVGETKPEPDILEYTEADLVVSDDAKYTEPRAVPDLAMPGFALFVNCTPMDPHPYMVMRAVDVVRPAAHEVERHESVPDYRMVEYGKGPGMLGASLRSQLETNPLPSNVAVLLDARTDEGRHTLQTFELFAGMVVRGL